MIGYYAPSLHFKVRKLYALYVFLFFIYFKRNLEHFLFKNLKKPLEQGKASKVCCCDSCHHFIFLFRFT